MDHIPAKVRTQGFFIDSKKIIHELGIVQVNCEPIFTQRATGL
jgi:hypothetical protein